MTVGDIIAVRVMVDATGHPVSVAQAAIVFDQNLLQVVDIGGSAATSVEQGAILTGGTWTQLLTNTADNSKGRIQFGAGKGPAGGSGVDATTNFELAVIRFKALAPTTGTNLAFHTTSDFKTNAFFSQTPAHEALTITTSNGNLVINASSGCAAPPVSGNWNIDQSCILSGLVQPPGNVIVTSGKTLTIDPTGNLDINLTTNHLLIETGAKVVIQVGGKIS